jgi:protein-S-isoprenylcysteine O-methyltransferase Ste14
MKAVADHADVVAPPPLIATVTAVIGAGLHHLWPVVLWPWSHVWIPTSAFFFAAALLAGAAGGMMWRARTSVLPHHTTTALVMSGPFCLTRNPLYLSLGLLLGGVAFAMNSLAGALVILPWAVVMRYGVIAREEQYLERKFGEDYRAYCRCVRRWL